MKFKQFLIRESKKAEAKIDLIFQKILDNIDKSHIDYNKDEYIEFNIGQLINNARHSDISVKIRSGGPSLPKIRNGIHKESSKAYVVIDVEEIPNRMDIDEFLSKKNVGEKFKKSLSDALSSMKDVDKMKLTKHEERSKNNKNDVFEQKYDECIKELNENLKKFIDAKKELETDIIDTLNKSKTSSAEGALKRLANEYVGATIKEFRKNAYKAIGRDYYESLSKELKDRLNARLEDYFELKIEPNLHLEK